MNCLVLIIIFTPKRVKLAKGNKPIKVEATTLSNKPNTKRGKVKIHMWQPRQIKQCIIMVSLYTGSNYVFVKTVLNKFIYKYFIYIL